MRLRTWYARVWRVVPPFSMQAIVSFVAISLRGTALTNKSEGFHACLLKHKCQGGMFPLINMSRPLNDQWDGISEIPGGGEAYYEASSIIRQVVFEGQPLYAQFYAQNGFNAHCNAFCAFHKWRLDNKKTWRQCAKSHKCWQGWLGMGATCSRQCHPL